MLWRYRTLEPLVCLAAVWLRVITVTLACREDELVTYRLDVETHWSKQRFPKQYPLFRPPAQFSKFIGMSHNSSRVLFRTGELASEAVRMLAEDGDSSGLELVAQGHPGILDQFTAPPIKQGEGTALVRLFVDGLHSKVSLMSRIVPSPDWFIGIDSLDLCDSGHWISELNVKLYPLDAGTDQGLTFTAPNWASDPHEPICQITSSRPAHPAGSFNYPDLQQLPPIASLRLSRVRSFAMSNDFEAGASVSYTVKATEPGHVLIASTSSDSSLMPGLRVFTVASDNSTASAMASSSRISHMRDHGERSQKKHHKKSKKTEKKFSTDRSVNVLPYWPAKNKTKSETLPRKSSKADLVGKWTFLSRQSNRNASHLSYPSFSTPTPSSSSYRSDHRILRPSDPSRSPVVASDSVKRVAIRPDGSVARVAIRPDGPPVQIGGLRVWAVSNNGGNNPVDNTLSWKNKDEKHKYGYRLTGVKSNDNDQGNPTNPTKQYNRDAWVGGGNEIRASHSERTNSVPRVGQVHSGLDNTTNRLVGSISRGLEGVRVPAGDRSAIIRRISDHYRHRRGRHRRRRMRHRRRKRIPRDCSVADWSAWGACSRTCGIGETTRVRSVLKHARRGGKPCPPLSERRWCGSARACRHRRPYFQW